MANNKIQSKNKKTYVLLKLLALLFSIFSLVVMQFSKEISLLVENSLGVHMIVEHSIFFLMGYSAAALLKKQNVITLYHQLRYYVFLQKKLSYGEKDIQEKQDNKQSKIKYLWFLTAISLMIFWHIPLVFDIASYDDLVHLFQHISFIIVGMCIYKIIKSFDFSFLLFFFILSGGFMGIMGLILILTNYPIYSSYTIQSHIDGGNYMIISGIIMMLVILPSVLIKKALELI
jgi:hypothetical protein